MAAAKQIRGTLGLSNLHKRVWNHQESLRKASANAARLAKERKSGKLEKNGNGKASRRPQAISEG